MAADLWFDWVRHASGGTQAMGWLSATPQTAGGYRLVWITTLVEDGELVELQAGERFGFDPRATPPTIPSQALFAVDEPN